jgi:hypothetical protein
VHFFAVVQFVLQLCHVFCSCAFCLADVLKLYIILRYNLLGRCRHCSGNYKAWGESGRKYKARIVIFRILAAVDRLSRILGKRKAIEENW